jgi:hypothetical protein
VFVSDDLPAELDPADLPDDPEVLKRLVCDLYATLMASEELLAAPESGVGKDTNDLGWLTQHLTTGGPAGHNPEQ